MLPFVVSRVLQTALVVFLALTATFFLLYLSGNPVTLFLPLDTSSEEIARVRAQLGFNDPLLVQYGRFLSNSLHGDFGRSLKYDEPALTLVLQRIPATLSLAAVSLLVALVFGVLLGVLSARYHNTWTDRMGVLISVLGQAVPGFWLGLLGIILFSVQLKWLPSSGYGKPSHFILPMLTLGLSEAAQFARLTRSSMLDVLSSNYVRTARAKGLGETVVVYKHALRNAVIPVLSLMGLVLGRLLGGAVIIETIFAWPGLGRLVVSSLTGRDFAVVRVGVLFVAVIFSMMSFITDMLYALVNPRIRLEP